MKREIITIDEYRVPTLPDNPAETVRMSEAETAELFGVNLPTIRTHYTILTLYRVPTENKANFSIRPKGGFFYSPE